MGGQTSVAEREAAACSVLPVIFELKHFVRTDVAANNDKKYKKLC